MASIVVVTNVNVKEGQEDLVKSELGKLVPLCFAEEGCFQFDFHQNLDNPLHFISYEHWASRTHWDTHMDTRHLGKFMEAVKDAVDEFGVTVMEKVVT